MNGPQTADLPMLERALGEVFSPYVQQLGLRILAATLVFRSLNATLAGIIQGAGRFRLLTGIASWNLVLVFALLSVFVPRFGAPGAALALLAGEGLNSVIQLLVVARLVAQHERTAAHAG